MLGRMAPAIAAVVPHQGDLSSRRLARQSRELRSYGSQRACRAAAHPVLSPHRATLSRGPAHALVAREVVAKTRVRPCCGLAPERCRLPKATRWTESAPRRVLAAMCEPRPSHTLEALA